MGAHDWFVLWWSRRTKLAPATDRMFDILWLWMVSWYILAGELPPLANTIPKMIPLGFLRQIQNIREIAFWVRWHHPCACSCRRFFVHLFDTQNLVESIAAEVGYRRRTLTHLPFVHWHRFVGSNRFEWCIFAHLQERRCNRKKWISIWLDCD